MAVRRAEAVDARLAADRAEADREALQDAAISRQMMPLEPRDRDERVVPGEMRAGPRRRQMPAASDRQLHVAPRVKDVDGPDPVESVRAGRREVRLRAVPRRREAVAVDERRVKAPHEGRDELGIHMGPARRLERHLDADAARRGKARRVIEPHELARVDPAGEPHERRGRVIREVRHQGAAPHEGPPAPREHVAAGLKRRLARGLPKRLAVLARLPPALQRVRPPSDGRRPGRRRVRVAPQERRRPRSRGALLSLTPRGRSSRRGCCAQSPARPSSRRAACR